MAFTLYKPIIYRDSPDLDGAPWNLVRGIEQTYDVESQVTGAHTGWSLVSAPGEFSISNAGVITADLPHLYTTNVGNLTIETDQRTITLPTTIRDWYPSDHPLGPSNYWSSWRSVDGTARELWVGTYLYPDNNNDLNVSQAVTVSSAVDGYLDLNTLETTLAAIANNGVLRVDTIRDQVGTFDLIAVSDQEFFALHMDSGSIANARQINGRLMFQGVWEQNDYDSSWAMNRRTNADYNAESTGRTLDNSYAISTFVEKYDGNDDGRPHRQGDNNHYPGIRHTSDGYYFNQSPPRAQTINRTPSGNPALMLASQTLRNSTVKPYRRSFSMWFPATGTVTGGIEGFSSGIHRGSGAGIEIEKYYWAEMAFYSFDHNEANRQMWVENDGNIATNLAAAFFGNSNVFTA